MKRFITLLLGAVLTLPLATRAADTCYVVMDGSATTNYFDYIGDAINSIGTGTGVVTMIADDSIMTSNLEMRINIVGNVTIVSDGGDYTIWRGVQQAPTNFTLLYVARFGESNAVLNLGSPTMTGTLTFDGGSFTNTSASLVLNYQNGTLNLYDGVILKNNISGFEGSGVYNEGTFNMYGGTIVSNVSFGLGGGVDNAGYWGGSKAVFNMYGGLIAHNASLYSATNRGGYGGGVANEGSAIFNLFGGAIENNHADIAGGGIFNAKLSNAYAHTNGALHATGGTVSGNTVGSGGMGNGIYSDKQMTAAGAAAFSGDNDVFLSNSVIVVAGALTEPGPVATISTANTSAGTPVAQIAGGAGVSFYDLANAFALVPGSGHALAVDWAADAIVRAPITCYVVMDGSSTTNYFGNLAFALSSVGTGTGVITMVSDDALDVTVSNRAINIVGNVTIVSDGGNYTISRTAIGTYTNYSMLYIARRAGDPTNAVLNLGAPAMPGSLTFDGGSFLNFGASIILNYRGTLNLYDGVTLKNNWSEYGGAGVYNEGIFSMYGGSIVSNIAYGTGGGVENNGYWGAPGVVNIYGGEIAYNQSLDGTFQWGGYGGGVANEGSGTLNMFGGSIHNNESEYVGGGVFYGIETSHTQHLAGTFNMSGGTISDNSVASGGIGSGVYSDGTFTMEGGALIQAGNEVYLASNAVITVTGALTNPGFVASISSTNVVPGTPLVVVDPGSGLALDDVLPSFNLSPGTDNETVIDPESDAIIAATRFQKWVLNRGHFLSDSNFFESADFDNDGATTWEEYIADTDPADVASIFTISGIALDDTLSWPSSSGRVYSVESVSIMEDGATWTQVGSDIAPTPPMNTITNLLDLLPPGEIQFIRTRVRLAP